MNVSQRNGNLNVSNHINNTLEATILVPDSSIFVSTCYKRAITKYTQNERILVKYVLAPSVKSNYMLHVLYNYVTLFFIIILL